jgi:membrane protein involved in colicin uptake
MATTTTARLEQQTGMKGFFVSATIHLVLLAILFFVTISSPIVEEFKEGLIIDFGDSETGSGDDPAHFAGGTTDAVSTPSPIPTPPSQPAQQVSAVTPVKTKSNTVVTESPEAIALKKQQLADQKAAAEKALKEKQYADSKAAMDSKWKKPGSGTGTGTGTSTGSGPGDGSGPGGPGNQGNPNGVVNGYGTEWSLKGRSLVTKKVPFNNTQEGGKVSVLIKVNRSGKVYYAKAQQKGSTTTNTYLFQLSESAAMQWIFNQNSDAAEEQIGTVVFNYTFD